MLKISRKLSKLERAQEYWQLMQIRRLFHATIGAIDTKNLNDRDQLRRDSQLMGLVTKTAATEQP